MRILVTGCAGFIGSHLCEKLIAERHTVIGIDNFDPFYSRNIKEENLSRLRAQEGFTFHEVDFTVKEQLERIQQPFDMLVHLAAKAGVRPSINDPEGYIRTNITGTLYLLDFIRSRGVHKCVFASSSSVYGNSAVAPFREDTVTDFPISPYAFTKKSGELLLHNYFSLYKVSSIALRFFTVFGPRQRPDLAIHKFFTAITEGKPIPVFGDGSTGRDYTYVEDTVQGIVNAISYLEAREVCDVFNLGNNTPVKLIDLIRKIEQVTGREAKLDFKPMQPGDVDNTCADISKAQKVLHYEPKVSMLEGLSRFYDWTMTRR